MPMSFELCGSESVRWRVNPTGAFPWLCPGWEEGSIARDELVVVKLMGVGMPGRALSHSMQRN